MVEEALNEVPIADGTNRLEGTFKLILRVGCRHAEPGAGPEEGSGRETNHYNSQLKKVR